MKKSLLLALFAVAGLAFNASAAEITIKGEGQCAKCSLKEAKECTDAIVVEENGKKTTYIFAKNDATKSLHKEICTAKKKLEATGTVKEVDGKKQFVASKVEVVK